MSLKFSLTANNSSGTQALTIYHDTRDDSFELALTGKYDGDVFQIDFDPVSRQEMEDLIYLLQRRLDQRHGAQGE
jgi:hypothetical protein